MSYFPLSTLNLKCTQVLVGANSAISTVGTTLALNSISGATEKVSLSSNTITLKAGVDYFIVTALSLTGTQNFTLLDASINNTQRLGFYNTTSASWLTQKCTNPTNTMSTAGIKNSGLRNHQAYCVIPAPASDINIQLRIKSNTTATLTTYLNNADANYGNSTITIYHN